jgi:hypothetical protein
MLVLALKINGIPDLSSLSEYIQKEFFQYGKQLTELKDNLIDLYETVSVVS